MNLNSIFNFIPHSNYPSALALSDTLNFLGVDNSAYELEKEYWNEIPTDCITLYNIVPPKVWTANHKS